LKLPIPRGRISHTVPQDASSFVRALFGDLTDSCVVDLFEREFSKRVGRKYAIAFPFARTGIYYILKSLDLPKGSVVLMPPLTIKPILDVVYALGLVPRFVDISLATACFDDQELEIALNDKVHVAILTYLFGIVPDVDRIVSLLRSKDVFIIEDFSQCLDGEFRSKKIGSFGDVSVYSASSVKTLDTYGGGIVVVDDESLHAVLRESQASLAPPRRIELLKKIFTDLARNVATSPLVFSVLLFPILSLLNRNKSSRLNRFTGSRDTEPIKDLPESWFRSYTSIQARFGLSQLEEMNWKNHDRLKNIRVLDAKVPTFRTAKGSNGAQNAYWQYVVYVEDFSRAKDYLFSKGIDTATTSLGLLSSFSSYPHSRSTPNADLVYSRGAYLPCYHQLTSKQIDRLVAAVDELFL
jgi:perosamine synthetase